MRWNGAVVFVTGASRGIGREVAVAAAARGARVGLVARTESDLKDTLAAAGGNGAIAVADVSSEASLNSAFATLEANLGPCDILVSNAGAGAYGAFLDTPVAEYERMIRVNYLSTVYAMKAVAPGMAERGRGHIVVVASIAGRIGAPLESAYSGSKFAQAGMAEAVAMELAGRGVGVSIVNPGPVKTSFFEARGAPYARKSPKPVDARAVAKRIVNAVERDKLDAYIPRWLGAAVIARAAMPSMYRIGTRRSFKL